MRVVRDILPASKEAEGGQPLGANWQILLDLLEIILRVSRGTM